MSRETKASLINSMLSIVLALAAILGGIISQGYYAGKFVASTEALQRDLASFRQELKDDDIPGIRYDVNNLKKDVSLLQSGMKNCRSCFVGIEPYNQP